MKKLFYILISILFLVGCNNNINEPIQEQQKQGFDFSKIVVQPGEEQQFKEFKSILQNRNSLRKMTDPKMDYFPKNFDFVDKISITGWDNQHTDDVRTAFLEGYKDAIFVDYLGLISTAIAEEDLDPANMSGAATPYYEYLEGYEALIHSYVSPVDWIHYTVYTPGGSYYVEGIENFLTVQAAGSNSFVHVNKYLPIDQLTGSHFITGCGIDNNTTGYWIEFFDKDPVYDKYSSFSNGYIGGTLVAIYNTALVFDNDINWDKVKTATIKTSTLSVWDEYDGYGKIQPLEALWYLFVNKRK